MILIACVNFTAHYTCGLQVQHCLRLDLTWHSQNH